MQKLSWPVDGVISQVWGARPEYYAKWGLSGHNGLDIAVPTGTPVLSMADGIVAWTGEDQDYGLYIRVFHQTLRLHTFVAHLSQVFVERGYSVQQGYVLGKSGNTGMSTGPHAHIEVRMGNSPNHYETIPNGMGSRGRVDPLTAMACSKAWLGE